MSLLDELPKTPDGEPITEAYWTKIEPEINKCGDKILELYGEYRDYPNLGILGEDKARKMADRLAVLMLSYGEVPFAVCITIFGEPLDGTLPVSVFDSVILASYTTMPEDLMKTVERLRFINTKYVERKNNLISKLRGRNIAFNN